MKTVELTETQFDYIKHIINDEIESAKATISCSDNKYDRQKAKAELVFFEEFKKVFEK